MIGGGGKGGRAGEGGVGGARVDGRKEGESRWTQTGGRAGCMGDDDRRALGRHVRGWLQGARGDRGATRVWRRPGTRASLASLPNLALACPRALYPPAPLPPTHPPPCPSSPPVPPSPSRCIPASRPELRRGRIMPHWSPGGHMGRVVTCRHCERVGVSADTPVARGRWGLQVPARKLCRRATGAGGGGHELLPSRPRALDYQIHHRPDPAPPPLPPPLLPPTHPPTHPRIHPPTQPSPVTTRHMPPCVC